MFMRRMFPLVTFDGEGGGGGPVSSTTPNEVRNDLGLKPDNSAFAELRRKADEAERRVKAAEDALAERDRKDAEAQGKWQELAAAEKARADKAESASVQVQQERMVERLASALKFHNPADVMHRLTAEQRADEGQAKAALEQIAKTDKYLVRSEQAPTPELGQVLAPSAALKDSKEPLTIEAIQAMTPREIADRWDEVQPVLAQQKKQ